MTVEYEWCIEYTDQFGDIHDHDRSPILAELYPTLDYEHLHPRVCLIRDQGNDDDGLLERGYAYPVDGVMPSEFDCGHKVPAKYHKEWARINP